MKFKVTERQLVIQVYIVEAEDRDAAERLVDDEGDGIPSIETHFYREVISVEEAK